MVRFNFVANFSQKENTASVRYVEARNITQSISRRQACFLTRVRDSSLWTEVKRGSYEINEFLTESRGRCSVWYVHTWKHYIIVSFVTATHFRHERISSNALHRHRITSNRISLANARLHVLNCDMQRTEITLEIISDFLVCLCI